MTSKILILRFSKKEAQKPIVCYLAKDLDLTFNILHAQILPRKEGVLVMELSGRRENFNKGVKYLRDQGIDVQNADQEVKRNEDRCIHCGACTAVCPTGALSVRRPEMSIDFTIDTCSVCEMCVLTCPTRGMVVRQEAESFF